MRVVSVCPDSSNRHSSTRVARCEYSVKPAPAPSSVAPSGYGRGLCRDGSCGLREMAAVRLPAAVGLALHRVIRDPGATGSIGDRHGLHYLLTDDEHAAEADRARTVDGTIRHPDHVEEP